MQTKNTNCFKPIAIANLHSREMKSKIENLLLPFDNL